MTQAIPGFAGKVYASTDGGTTQTVVGEVREATLSISVNEIDATSYDSQGWEEYIPGMKSWELEVDQLYVQADAGQVALYNALVNGVVLDVYLYPKDENGETGYSGKAFITSWELGEPVDDAVTLSVSMRGSGALASVTKS